MEATGSSEATTDRRTVRRTVVFVCIAAAVGVVLSTFAPPNWEQGSGRVTLQVGGMTMIDEPTTIGTTEQVSFSILDGTDRFTIDFSAGIPIDDDVQATIGLLSDGTSVRPNLEDVTLRIHFAEGPAELVPVVGWDDNEDVLVAVRRPPRNVGLAVALLAFVAILWVTEAVPLFVTSLSIPVVLVFSGSLGATEATAPFFNPIIVLFFAGFLMAEALKRSGLDHLVATAITAKAARSPVTLFATLLGVTAGMSMFMSNTAAAAVLMPIAITVTAPLESAEYRKTLVLGIAYAATIGGVASAIGTPANLLAIEFLDNFGERTISFAEWFAFGVPMLVLFLPIAGAYLWWRDRPAVDSARFAAARAAAVRERAEMGSPSRDQAVVLAVFVCVIAGWLTQGFHDVHAGIVALAGALVLFAVGRLRPEDLSRISWPSLLTFGGGLALGVFLVESGASDYLATRLTALGNIPTPLAVLAVALITVALTTVASNTASAAILIPLAIPLAGVVGVSPTALVLVVAIASSIDFALVVGTPPTMIAYSTGLFTSGEIFRRGAVLDLVGIAVLAFGVVALWEFVGLA